MEPQIYAGTACPNLKSTDISEVIPPQLSAVNAGYETGLDPNHFMANLKRMNSTAHTPVILALQTPGFLGSMVAKAQLNCLIFHLLPGYQKCVWGVEGGGWVDTARVGDMEDWGQEEPPPPPTHPHYPLSPRSHQNQNSGYTSLYITLYITFNWHVTKLNVLFFTGLFRSECFWLLGNGNIG